MRYGNFGPMTRGTFKSVNIRNIMDEAVRTGGIIVDVRQQDKFLKSHIPMAINLPLEVIKQGRTTLPKSKVLILYCETGATSMLAAKILSENGYRVINTVGGMQMYNGTLTKRENMSK